ncbi:MAG: alanine--tRNA ligase [Candidatus Eisenbacteria bacterium]|uniref:Alanine--tRNA ligase n=1 Tax=Eiseniibacteriota bacterium TaxID=2212470 RepID=A0A938BNU6_UNCEI|nr:alanine--tRNA ligase [Candidatus Eisenbacteria bacterium]
MTANEIRRRFVEFYLARDHKLVPSAPLVPQGDPTLLFTSAGMVQFKQYYSGAAALPFRRAVSVQKCLRVTDIEDVGRTPRHDTFFEMLGHFSFGDYFKREAIAWNWEFFTGVLGLAPERLTASVFQEDDEAYEIWRRSIGLPPERIVRLGAKDNFWGPAGDTGACGPCSELYFDLGPELDPNPDARPGDETNRFVEVGNFVFPQFDRQKDGTDLPLKNRGIDTGIGLERLAMVCQGQTTIFRTDLFWPLIAEAGRLCQVDYAGHEVALHIIADHARALTFALGEGILPANEGRGYVIRRLIRRAAVQAYQLGRREPLLHRLVDPVVAMMRETYPEVEEGRERAALALRAEEERFGETLAQAMGRFDGLLAELGRAGATEVPGPEAFLLHDTYGMPIELVAELAAGRGWAVDRAGFERCLAQQKERSRAAASFSAAGEALAWQRVGGEAHSEFVGYDSESAPASVVRFAPAAGEPARAWVVLDRTPFYGASGGQVGDTGLLRSGGTVLEVLDAQRADAEIRHLVGLETPGAADLLGEAGRAWEAEIDRDRRAQIRRHHTATHLLHAALRRVLGRHVAQAGSLVSPERLRFDFTHFSALTPEEREEVERGVNEAVVADHPVEIRFSTRDEALADGAVALFGEKYDADRVRRVRVAGVSEELCGGTHVSRTGEIGLLLILEEGAVAAGTRRIEAVCGPAALAVLQGMRRDVGHLRRLLGTTLEGAPEKVEQLLAEGARLRKELARARSGEGAGRLDELLAGAEAHGGRRAVVGEVAADSVEALREIGDRVRRQLGSGGGLLAARIGGKTALLALATDDLVEAGALRADELLRAAAAVAGGSGGGKPHMALGGVRDPQRLGEVLDEARRLLSAALERA